MIPDFVGGAEGSGSLLNDFPGIDAGNGNRAFHEITSMRDNILVRELTCACETRVSGRAAPIQPKRKGSRGMNGLSTKRVIPQKPSKQVCHFRPAFCQNRTTRPRRPQPRRLRGYCTSKPANCVNPKTQFSVTTAKTAWQSWPAKILSPA